MKLVASRARNASSWRRCPSRGPQWHAGRLGCKRLKLSAQLETLSTAGDPRNGNLHQYILLAPRLRSIRHALDGYLR